MVGLFVEMFQPVNVVPSVLLILVLIYWGLVILGAVTDDMLDLDVEGSDAATPWLGVFKFLHAGDVPIMVVVSLFVVLFWASTILSNHYLNPQLSGWVTAYMMIPNLILTLLVTKAILFPTVQLLKKYSLRQEIDRAIYVGQRAVVNTGEITDEFGQIAIPQEGPPIVVNARCFGSRPRKGDVVEIVEYQPETETYLVRLAKRMG